MVGAFVVGALAGRMDLRWMANDAGIADLAAGEIISVPKGFIGVLNHGFLGLGFW